MNAQKFPVRMVVIIPVGDEGEGPFLPYCIACEWRPSRASVTREAAEAVGKHHNCPPPRGS